MSSDAAAAQHVTRTLQALEHLARGPQTQADIARHLDVHRRTARRLLARLEDEGYVRVSPQGQRVGFEPTARLVVLGKMVADRLDLSTIGARLLEHADMTGVRSWFLTFVDRRGAWIGGSVPAAAEHSGRTTEPRLRRESLHAQAEGKVFLSADTALLGEVLNQNLLRYTPKTLASRADLLLELARIRSQGYAIEEEEHEQATRAAASGVMDHTGRTVAAVGAVLLEDAEIGSVAYRVRDIARTFTAEIGGATQTELSAETRPFGDVVS